MKKIFIPILVLSATLFANITQEVADKMFDECMRLDPSSKSTTPYVTTEYCDGLWIPIFDRKEPKGYLVKSFNSETAKKETGEMSVKEDKYYAFFDKKQEKQIVDEFGNKSVKYVNAANFMLRNNLKKLKSSNERNEELVRYNVDFISFHGFLGTGRFDASSKKADSNIFSISGYITGHVNASIQTGGFPSSWTVSMNDRTSKNGIINSNIDTYGLTMKIFKYFYVRNKSTILNREILMASFLSAKGHDMRSQTKGREPLNIVFSLVDELYDGANKGDVDSVKLTLLFANASYEEASEFLLSIPQVKSNFNFAKKHFEL